MAYGHWSGKVDFALQSTDVPDELMANTSVKELADQTYGVTCKIVDESSRSIAEELLFLALEKLRTKTGPW